MDEGNDLFSRFGAELAQPAPKSARPADPLVEATRKAAGPKPSPSGPKSAAPRDASDAYSAADIEVLEGLEPVRRRPGMYIGGTDDKAMHHLFAEVIDN